MNKGNKIRVALLFLFKKATYLGLYIIMLNINKNNIDKHDK